jgi:ATP-dependent 26S proteasome regulatory subunit
MTTDEPQTLDEALLSSGRIDMKIEFKKASIDDIKNS